MTNRFFIFILFLISSCAFLDKKIESHTLPLTSEKTGPSTKKNVYCSNNSKIQIKLEDDSTVKFYSPLMKPFFENQSLSFIQKAAILSLVEMSRRPDKASPSARIQYFLRFSNQDYYFDFRPKKLEDDSKMPYLKGVASLLQNFDNSKSLIQLSEIIEQKLPENINISQVFESFLRENQNDILQNKILSGTFLKGDEILTKHETFKRNTFKNIIRTYNTDNISNDSNYEFSKNSLFEIETDQANINIKCNFDFTKESSLKEDFLLTEQNKSHSFALKDGDNFFIAVSSSITQIPIQNYGLTYFLKARPAPEALPICHFKNKSQNIVLFSSSGRNPSQHLKHLVDYDINSITTFRSLEEVLNFPRHLFLSNPNRILYESKKGRKSQLDFFLNMNFPIYHVDKLGELIGIGIFNQDKKEEKSLIIDSRSENQLRCGM